MLKTDIKLQVFLCHASQDKPAVSELYNALMSEHWIDPWLDKAKILPGQDWRVVIEKAVEVSEVVIVCLSNKSVGKEGYVQKEIRYVYDIALEKPEDTIFLIPLRLEDCNTPRGLRAFQRVDYFGINKNDNYKNLLEALRIRYEQRLPFKIEEMARKQKEDEDRQRLEQFRRQELEKALQLIQEQKRKDAEKQAKREAELLARKELEEKKARQEQEERKRRDEEEQAKHKADMWTQSMEWIPPFVEAPRKNNSTLVIITTIIVILLCCSIGYIVWFYGDAIIQAYNL